MAPLRTNILYGLIACCVTGLLVLEPDHGASLGGAKTSTRVIDETYAIITEPPVVKAQSLWGRFGEWREVNGNPCCQDLLQLGRVAEIKDGRFKHPASCRVEGASCQFLNVDAWTSAPIAPEACVDSGGWARSSPAVDADHIDSAGIDLPACPDGAPSTTDAGWGWWLRILICHVFPIYTLAAFLITACFPVKLGNDHRRGHEFMSYSRRLQAVIVLWAFGGGWPFMFIVFETFMSHRVWLWQTTWEGILCLLTLVVSTYATMRPLPYKFPRRDILKSWVFDLLNEYFDVTYYSESEGGPPIFGHKGGKKKRRKNREKNAKKKKKEDETYLLAQMPHGIIPYGAVLGASVLDDIFPDVWPVSGVVASILFKVPILRHFITLLGCRRAGGAIIQQMFADGFKAVGVVTGGISDMFLSWEDEKLTPIRKNFGRAALKGGHTIVPIFAFGASRTLSPWPLFNNRLFKYLSRKYRAPLMPYWGAFFLFDCIPHRQQIKVAAGRPIKIKKVTGEITDEMAQTVCDQVQAAVHDLYTRKKPWWENRPLVFKD